MLKNKTALRTYLPPAMAGGAFALTLVVITRLLLWSVSTQNPELLHGITGLALALPILIVTVFAAFFLALFVAFIILLKCKTSSIAFLLTFGSILSLIAIVVITVMLAPLGYYIPVLISVGASILIFVLIHSIRSIPVLFRSIILVALCVLAIVFTYQSQDPLKEEKVLLEKIRSTEYTLLVPPKNGNESAAWYIKPYGQTYSDGARIELAYNRVMYADTKELIETKAPIELPKSDCSNGYLLSDDERTDTYTCTFLTDINGTKIYHQQQESFISQDNQYQVAHTYFAVTKGTLVKTGFSRTTIHDAQRELIDEPSDFTRSKDTQQAILTTLQPINNDDLLDILGRS